MSLPDVDLGMGRLTKRVQQSPRRRYDTALRVAGLVRAAS